MLNKRNAHHSTRFHLRVCVVQSLVRVRAVARLEANYFGKVVTFRESLAFPPDGIPLAVDDSISSKVLARFTLKSPTNLDAIIKR